ncbi:hypothetical protein SteCoe_6349 [Stentor coeruleus]|uniref:USP domain-containing protein n=1 Tax=Stentor coeruleus TaxID=5963 RepID=A0A1R2CQ94_9CILI|nr:hypothetical protein SteCoe_6349 [Stentor coeruleus]
MEPGIKEIQNLKNTCYINSIVQLISHVWPLKEVFCDVLEKNAIPENLELLNLFHQLCNEIWSEDRVRIKPEAFVKKCFTLSPYFVQYTQQDSQEFLMVFLDKLDQELISCHPRGFSIITDTFKGAFTNEIKCTACSFTSEKTEAFLQLDLPIPENAPPIRTIDCLMSAKETMMISESQHGLFSSLISVFTKEKATLNLYYCLKAFFQEQSTEAYCQQCQCHKPHIIRPRLSEPPKYLLISLKRFKYKFWSTKVSDNVFVPKNLNSAHFSSLGYEYSLSAVIEHNGFVSRGHYKIYLNNFGTWWLLDDNKVRKVPWEDVFNAQAYICMYIRKDICQRIVVEGSESVYCHKNISMPMRFMSRDEE